MLHAKEDKEGSVLTLIVRLSKSAGIHLLLGRTSIVYRDLQILLISPSPIVVDPTISCMWGCPGREKGGLEEHPEKREVQVGLRPISHNQSEVLRGGVRRC